MLLRMFPHPLGCVAGLVLFGIAGTAFWIWALIDCATKEPNEEPPKILWILLIVLLHFVGALLYVLIRRPDRVRKFGR